MLNIPQVFRRSATRGGRQPRHETVDQASVARIVSAQLGNMLDKVEGANLKMLAYLIDIARIEAERIIRQGAAIEGGHSSARPEDPHSP